MSKITVADLIRQWTQKVPKRAERLSRSQVSEIIKTAPDSLEARLATNPYAAMLSSPLRRCGFHTRMFPSSLLLRFALGWHVETKRNWAYPTVGNRSERGGFGYYVRLNKGVLEAIKKGGYNALFRGKATYRSDMTEHVEHKLCQQIQTQFEKQKLDSFDLLKPVTSQQWSSLSSSRLMGYQCILVFDSKLHQVSLNHSIVINNHTTQHDVPCYPMHRIMSSKSIDKIRKQMNLDPSQPIVLGLSKSPETVQLAVDLWRYYCLFEKN